MQLPKKNLHFMTSRHYMKYLYCKEKSYVESEQSKIKNKKLGTPGSYAMPTGSMAVRPGVGPLGGARTEGMAGCGQRQG